MINDLSHRHDREKQILDEDNKKLASNVEFVSSVLFYFLLKPWLGLNIFAFPYLQWTFSVDWNNEPAANRQNQLGVGLRTIEEQTGSFGSMGISIIRDYSMG